MSIDRVYRSCLGVKSDIVGLMEIPSVKASRARALSNAGYKTVKHICQCSHSGLYVCAGHMHACPGTYMHA